MKQGCLCVSASLYGSVALSASEFKCDSHSSFDYAFLCLTTAPLCLSLSSSVSLHLSVFASLCLTPLLPVCLYLYLKSLLLSVCVCLLLAAVWLLVCLFSSLHHICEEDEWRYITCLHTAIHAHNNKLSPLAKLSSLCLSVFLFVPLRSSVHLSL